MKRSTYIWSLLVGCVAFATSCDLTEDVQVKADKSMIFGSKSGLELYSNSFYKALPTLKNGFMQDKMCDVGAVSNTDTFIKRGAFVGLQHRDGDQLELGRAQERELLHRRLQ